VKYDDHPTIQDTWLDEAERFEWNDADQDIADCAVLADELAVYAIMVQSDETFWDSMSEWDCFIMENNLWLPLEQCCYQGVLLPMGQRELRVKTCPPEMLGHISYFFSRCPVHVKHHLALRYSVMVRADRGRRSGNPDWRPDTAPPRPPYYDTVFFRPPILTFRDYAR
jgi:hypothetical protein